MTVPIHDRSSCSNNNCASKSRSRIWFVPDVNSLTFDVAWANYMYTHTCTNTHAQRYYVNVHHSYGRHWSACVCVTSLAIVVATLTQVCMCTAIIAWMCECHKHTFASYEYHALVCVCVYAICCYIHSKQSAYNFKMAAGKCGCTLISHSEWAVAVHFSIARIYIQPQFHQEILPNENGHRDNWNVLINSWRI